MTYVLARLVQDNGLNKEKGRSMLQLLPIYVLHGSIPVNSSSTSSPHPSDLRPSTLALILRQVLRDKSGGQSHFLGFFHKELHKSIALVLHPIVEYGILECFLQIADLA